MHVKDILEQPRTGKASEDSDANSWFPSGPPEKAEQSTFSGSVSETLTRFGIVRVEQEAMMMTPEKTTPPSLVKTIGLTMSAIQRQPNRSGDWRNLTTRETDHRQRNSCWCCNFGSGDEHETNNILKVKTTDFAQLFVSKIPFPRDKNCPCAKPCVCGGEADLGAPVPLQSCRSKRDPQPHPPHNRKSVLLFSSVDRTPGGRRPPSR